MKGILDTGGSKMSLQIQSSFDQNSQKWEIILSGEIDISSAQDFRDTLEKAYADKKSDIVLRCDNLNYIDSTGLGVIIGAYGKMNEQQNSIKIQNPKQNIKKLLTITKLDQILL
jgi:anti-sigma B factor antagonist